MKKKVYLPFFMLIIIFNTWWFLNRESTPSPQEGVLDVWVTWGDSPDQLQTLFDRFGKSNGISIQVTTQVREDDLLDALRSEHSPDLVILSSNQLIQSYADQDLIETLDSRIEASGINLEDIYPVPLAQCMSPDNTIQCLPWGGDVFALYWNKDLFAAAGLDPEHPPQTMEELTEFAQVLTQVEGDGNPIRMGFMPDFSRSHSDLYARMLGGSWFTEGGSKVTANSIPVAESLKWQAQFFEGYPPAGMKKFALSVNGFINSSHPEYGGARLDCQQCHRAKPAKENKIPDHSFFEGKLAMIVAGQWQEGGAYIPHFKPDLNYGVAAFPPPAGHPERAGTSIIQGPVVVIPSGAVDQHAAVELLAWMMSPEIVAEISLANALLPTSQTAAADPRFQQMPSYELFMSLLSGPNAYVNPASPFYFELNQAVQAAEKAILQAEGQTPDAVLDEVQAQFSP